MAPRSLRAADVPEAFEYPLFDGRSLDGWRTEVECGVTAKAGVLRLESGDGWIRTDQQFADFDLHVEWRALKQNTYDAGIYIRALPGGKPFPKTGYQINLKQGSEGELIGVANTKGGAKLSKPAGEWNAFDVSVHGDHVALKVNGEEAYNVAGLKVPRGHVGIQVEVPLGGQYELRNIRIRELSHSSLIGTSPDGTLADWNAVGPAGGWNLADGILTCTGKTRTWLRSKVEHADFNLRLEYQVAPGANSGVYVRVPADGKHHRENTSLPPAGFEVQILDDDPHFHPDLKDYQYSASIYDIAGAKPRLSKPAGRWNTLEINCRGPRVWTIHNGVKVADADASRSAALALRSKKGYLGLQSHNGVVKFRNVRIGPAVDLRD